MELAAPDTGVERVLEGLERLLRAHRDAVNLASDGRMDQATIAGLDLAAMETCAEAVRGVEEMGSTGSVCEHRFSETGRQLGDEPKPGHVAGLSAGTVGRTRIDCLECIVIGNGSQPNRRVRTRTLGGVTGTARESLPMSISG